MGRPRVDGIPAGRAPDSRNTRRVVVSSIERTLEHASLSPAAPIVLEPSIGDLERAAALVEDETSLAQLYGLWALGIGIFNPSSAKSMACRIKAADSLASLKGWFKASAAPVQVNLTNNAEGGVSFMVIANERGPQPEPFAQLEAEVIDCLPEPSDPETPR